LQDLLDYALKEAEVLGASDAEACAAESAESEVFIENNDVKQAKSQKTGSVGVRVFVNGSAGFYSVNSLKKDKVKGAVSMAVKIARVSPKDRYNSLPGKSKARPLLGIFDKKALLFAASDAARMASELLWAAKSHDKRVSVDSGNFTSNVTTRWLANSNRIELSERASIFSWSIMGMAIDGGNISSFDFQLGGSHFAKDIDVQTTATEFAETVINSLGPRKIDSFNGEMLLTPVAVNEMMEEAISHSINSDATLKARWAGGWRLTWSLWRTTPPMWRVSARPALTGKGCRTAGI
jgi:PmbA protein